MGIPSLASLALWCVCPLRALAGGAGTQVVPRQGAERWAEPRRSADLCGPQWHGHGAGVGSLALAPMMAAQAANSRPPGGPESGPAARAPQQPRPGRDPGFESCMCPNAWCLNVRRQRGFKMGQVSFPRGTRTRSKERQEAWLYCAMLGIPADCDCDGRCDCTTVRPPPPCTVSQGFD